MIITSTLLNNLENRLDDQITASIFDDVAIINGSIDENDSGIIHLVSLNEIKNLINQGKIIILKVASNFYHPQLHKNVTRIDFYNFLYLEKFEDVDEENNPLSGWDLCFSRKDQDDNNERFYLYSDDTNTLPVSDWYLV